MHFKMVHSNIKNATSRVGFKCATYAQSIPLYLNVHCGFATLKSLRHHVKCLQKLTKNSWLSWFHDSSKTPEQLIMGWLGRCSLREGAKLCKNGERITSAWQKILCSKKFKGANVKQRFKAEDDTVAGYLLSWSPAPWCFTLELKLSKNAVLAGENDPYIG